MFYERPAVLYQGYLNDVLRGLITKSPNLLCAEDSRINRLLEFIDSRQGSIGCSFDCACRELKLNITGAYARRLFKRLTGSGAREYTERRRMLFAAERLTHTSLPIKVIAAEIGYSAPPHFTRRFKEQFQLSPTEFRRKRLFQSQIGNITVRK